MGNRKGKYWKEQVYIKGKYRQGQILLLKNSLGNMTNGKYYKNIIISFQIGKGKYKICQGKILSRENITKGKKLQGKILSRENIVKGK